MNEHTQCVAIILIGLLNNIVLHTEDDGQEL